MLKKIFFIVCATLLVLSVSATPANITTDGEETNITAVGWSYDQTSHDVYVHSDSTNYIFELTTDLDMANGTTYTFANMNPDWTGTLDNDGYMDIKASDATLLVIKDESDGLVHIMATMVLNGDTYKITYHQPANITWADKYNVTGKGSTDGGVSWTDEPAWVATTGFNAYGPIITNFIPKGPFTSPIDFNYDMKSGKYVIPIAACAQIDAQNMVYAMDVTDFLAGGSGDIYLDVAKDGAISIPAANSNHVFGYAKATFDPNTNAPVEIVGVYNMYSQLTYSFVPPTDTVKVNIDNIIIDEDFYNRTDVHRGWLFESRDANCQYLFQVLGDEKFGTFSYADGTLGKHFYNVMPMNGQEMTSFARGSITIAEVGDSIVLDGVLVAEDEKAYVFHLSQLAGIISNDTNSPLDATFDYRDMSASLKNGVISISATNSEDLTIDLELYTDPANTTIPAGTYVINNSQETGTALRSIGITADGQYTKCYAVTRDTKGITIDAWFMVDGTITLSYDEYGKLKVEVNATNSWGQPVTISSQYVRLNPKNTVEITNASLEIYDDYVESRGLMHFVGYNLNYTFDLYARTDTFAGNFVNNIDLDNGAIYLADGSYVGFIDAFEFEVVADGKYHVLTAKLLGTDTIQYNISASCYLGSISFDAQENYEGTFEMKDITMTQTTETLVMITGRNEAGDTLALAIEGNLTNGALAAGEYTKIVASTGMTDDSQFIPSFVFHEYYVWLIQSGKLTVSEDGSMIFDGLNSYGQIVKATINKQSTDLISLPYESKDGIGSVKFIQNGRLLIEHNGVLYDARGASVK